MHDTYCKRSKKELVLRSFNHDVEAALCCKSQHPISLFDKNKLQKAIDDLDNGIRNKHCTICWLAEDKGELSWRQIGNDLEIPAKSIEIYFDNTCDQACIYCSPKYSSKWVQEIKYANKDNSKFLKQIINDESFEPTPKQDHKKEIMSEIENAGANAEKNKIVAIILLGGEPLISPQFVKKNILEEIVETFYSKADESVHLKLNIVTNGNTPDAQIDSTINIANKLLKKYTNLKIIVQLSIESTGKNAEYVRYGLNYDQFVKNIIKYFQSDIRVGFSMSINTVSYLDTANFMQYVIDTCDKHDPLARTFFNFNIVDFPEFLSIKTLPKDYEYILDQCQKICEKSYNSFYDVHFYNKILQQIEHARKKLGLKVDPKLYTLAGNYFDYIKNYRHLDLHDVNDELCRIIGYE